MSLILLLFVSAGYYITSFSEQDNAELIVAEEGVIVSFADLKTEPSGGRSTNHILKREYITLSNNDSTKFADWVAYRLTKEIINGPKRRRKWEADPALTDAETLEPNDYKKAHKMLETDRGHQAPLGSFDGWREWQTVNYLSNITPQKSALNQGPWRALEERVRLLVEKYDSVYVMTGPYYQDTMPALPKADESHVIPSGYWKIVVISTDGKGHITSFLFSQETPRSDQVVDHITSVDSIETITGLNFFENVEDSVEEKIEQQIFKQAWYGDM